MKQTDQKDNDNFEILRKISKKPHLSQREMSKELGFSLGKLNYCLKGLKKKGLIQLKSLIPHSYPGHNILTDDLGVVLGEDDCSCGKKGKYFRIIGRLRNSELRGCSNV